MNIKQLITAALIASAAFATQAAPQNPYPPPKPRNIQPFGSMSVPNRNLAKVICTTRSTSPSTKSSAAYTKPRPTKTRRSTSTAAADGVPKPPFKS